MRYRVVSRVGKCRTLNPPRARAHFADLPVNSSKGLDAVVAVGMNKSEQAVTISMQVGAHRYAAGTVTRIVSSMSKSACLRHRIYQKTTRSMNNEQNSRSRTLKFLAALVMVASVNTLLSWPADTGRAHWSEWFVFYFFPPFGYASILVLLFYVGQKVQIARSSRQVVRLPLVGIFWCVTGFVALSLIGLLTH